MSTEQILSFVVSIVGIVGLYFAGNNRWWSWYINLACQIPWVVLALMSELYGLLMGSTFYIAVFGRNAVVWTKKHFNEPVTTYHDGVGHVSARGEVHLIRNCSCEPKHQGMLVVHNSFELD